MLRIYIIELSGFYKTRRLIDNINIRVTVYIYYVDEDSAVKNYVIAFFKVKFKPFKRALIYLIVIIKLFNIL